MRAPGKMMAYSVKIEEADEGGYVVTVPSLPGCVTQGETYEEALVMAQEAIEGFLDACDKAPPGTIAGYWPPSGTWTFVLSSP